MSLVGQEQCPITADELWQMPEAPGKRFELADGELVELPGAGGLHNLIVGVVYGLLRSFVLQGRLGPVFSDGAGYLLRRDPDLLRIPDISFVSWDRLPGGRVPEGYMPAAPDLAVEVVSPNDRAADVHDKVREYLDAGCRMVLVLWPGSRSATVHEQGGLVRDLGPEAELNGGGVLPGFRVRVGELFEVQESR